MSSAPAAEEGRTDHRLWTAKSFVDLEVYRLAEELADELWQLVSGWDYLARDTVGKQMVKAADSIGANLAEGFGRGSYQDNRRYVRIARGSLNETRHWLRRAYCRGLLKKEQIAALAELVDELAPRLNAYLAAIGTRGMSRDKVGSHAK